MLPRAVLVLSLVLAASACGRSEAPASRSASVGSSNGGDRADTSQRESAEAHERSAACPARFGDQGPTCAGDEAHLTCDYPEGQCYCGAPRRCSGVPPQPEPPSWVCVPREPPCPPVGAPCSAGEVGCSPWCCGMAVVCVEGVWTPQEVPCPP